ncbi:MAG: aldo/keto reductase [Promethearchaeota archaeon]
MKHRKIETMDWSTSVLGFGCMRLPTIGEGDAKKINEPKAIEQIRYGIDSGINYVDTAWPYHNKTSETLVGKALLDGYREKVCLVTKAPIWEYKVSDDFDKCLQIQLDKLQVDHVDIYLLHALNKDRFSKVKELNVLESAIRAKEKGLIRFIGFSFHGNYEVFRDIIDAFAWDICQIQFNYLDINSQATEKGLIYAGEKNIPVIIMEPLRGGKLVRETPQTKEIVENAHVKRTLAEWAFQFVWNYPQVKVVLSGMNTIEMIKENIESASNSEINSLTPEDFKVIWQLRDAYQGMMVVPCTQCEYCMPCSSGVDIPTNLQLLNEAAWTGSAKEMQVWFDGLAQSPDDLKEKPDSGAAQLCIECNECLDKCPQSIQIPDEMKKVVAIYQDGQDPKGVI